MEILGQIPTAPFGAGRLSLVVVRTQGAVNAGLAGKPVHKWKVFRNVCEARPQLGISDRALAVLDALLSFHPDTVLISGAADLVVYPSNRQLALRAHGVAASTLRRHLAALVDGLILRRDSPNGKRYARRGPTGDVEQAFGFDLSPIIARADEFARLADRISKERQVLDLLREQATLARRDIAKMISTGVAEGIDADWSTVHDDFRDLVGRLPRVPSCEALEPIVRELSALAAVVLEILQRHVAQSEEPYAPADKHDQDDSMQSPAETAPALQIADQSTQGSKPTAIPVRLVLAACPDFADYARGDIRTVRDLFATASLVRLLLGISPIAWDDACGVMGQGQASVALAAILQRGDAIKSPGGYLRTLTRRASTGEFSVWPMLMALVASRQKLESGRAQKPSNPFPPG